MNESKRLIIVSNRLPIKIASKAGSLTYQNSEGGLATGLGSVFQQDDSLWIGWPGAEIEEGQKATVTADLAARRLQPVFLNHQEITDFYEGFSNETIWPLFHYFPSYATFVPQQYDCYENVNRKFADAIIKVAGKDDVIWIHDYQLLLLPAMIREALPDVTIGFFCHIPFPSYEVFRLLPWRRELLLGMMGADVMGFHTYDDVRHFLSAATRITGVPVMANQLQVEGRTVIADAFPISIDYKKYHSLAEEATTRRLERKLRSLMHTGKFLLSIDRLDYSKGIAHRLHAYEVFLEKHPEMHGKVTLLQLVVPSRDTVPKYKELKEEVDRLVGNINGRFGKLGWQPIQHFYRSFPLPLLSALYRMADVALVTPMRDGMNLVSKEYVASKIDSKGVLILSEMAGAARELSEALIVNPNDIWQVADAMHQALTMPDDEQRRRMTAMQQTVSRFDIHNWVDNFMDKLTETRGIQQSVAIRSMTPAIRQKMAIRYHFAQNRLIFLDYDGTLVPFNKVAKAAVPDNELLRLMARLCADPHNKVVITSGRDYETLDAWLGSLPVDMIAEHGAWYKDRGQLWRSRSDLTSGWKDEIRRIMEVYNRRTPGASIEEKSYSLAWHYRAVETGMGELRAQELMMDVSHFVSGRGLQVLQGDKVLEVKSIAVNKGRAARRWLDKGEYDFILAIGDDHTDEDTFKALPPDAISIKVGSNPSVAAYSLPTHKEVRALLQEFCQSASMDEGTRLMREAS